MTGSLQVKNGKYYAVLNMKDSDGKRKPKWIGTGFEVKGNKKRAEKRLRELLDEYSNKKVITINKKLLFHDFVLEWLENYKTQVDIITWEGYKNTTDAHVVPYFKELNIELKNLTTKHIQKYYDKKFKNGRRDGKGGLSARTIKLHSVVINLACKDAIEKELISINPALNAKVPKQDKSFKGSFYTVEQANALLRACKDELVYPIYHLTLNYGLRRSEVMGLKWDAIDFENNILTIKHTVVKNTTIVRKDKTKNHASSRSYPLMDDVKSILLQLKSEQDKNRKLFGKEYFKSDYVFVKPDGSLIRPDYVTSRLGSILKNNNLPHIRLHDLRHTTASILLSKGWTLKDIQEWLGHSDISITANIYTHIDIKRKQELAKGLSNTFMLDESENNQCVEKR